MASERTTRITPKGELDRVATRALNPQGFERIERVQKSSFRDCSMVILIPTRDDYFHRRFVEHFNAISWPMNGKRTVFHITGAEVGKAYTEQIQVVLGHPELSKWRYVLTIEDDVLVPSNCVTDLCEAIEAGPFDVAAGMYFTKGDGFQAPMAYGDPAEYARTGVLDFRPRDISEALKAGAIMPVNGVAMGCTLYRMQLFKDLPAPWFVTNPSNTQDLYFSANARRAGKTIAVDCRVRCGHMDFESGKVY